MARNDFRFMSDEEKQEMEATGELNNPSLDDETFLRNYKAQQQKQDSEVRRKAQIEHDANMKAYLESRPQQKVEQSTQPTTPIQEKPVISKPKPASNRRGKGVGNGVTRRKTDPATPKGTGGTEGTGQSSSTALENAAIKAAAQRNVREFESEAAYEKAMKGEKVPLPENIERFINVSFKPDKEGFVPANSAAMKNSYIDPDFELIQNISNASNNTKIMLPNGEKVGRRDALRYFRKMYSKKFTTKDERDALSLINQGLADIKKGK